jgi:hypothetical protein
MSAFKKSWLFVAALFAFGLAAFFANGGAHGRQDSRGEVNPQPLPPGYFSGLVGLSSGQHVRLSVVSLLPTPAPGQPPQKPAAALLELFSELGDLLSKRQDQIADGGSTFLDSSFEDLTSSFPPGSVPTRLEIRAVAFGIVDSRDPQAAFRVSLEIYDTATGKTRIAHEVVIAFEEGDPDQPLVVGKISSGPIRFRPGLIGLASGQHARLNVASLLPKPQPGAAPGDPTAVELTFFTDQGAVIATSQVLVGVGETKFLDISFDDAVNAVSAGLPVIPPGPSTRVEIRASAVAITDLTNPARHPPQPCMPSLEIYDVDTGKSTVAFLPAVQK